MSGVEASVQIDPEGPDVSSHLKAESLRTQSDASSSKIAELFEPENRSGNSPVDPPSVSCLGIKDSAELGQNFATEESSVAIQSDIPNLPTSSSGQGSSDATGSNVVLNNVQKFGSDKHMQKDGSNGLKVRKSSRSSCYRGVSRNRWTGRYEAHLWDGLCQLEGRKRKGKLVYLGGYDSEEVAGRAHDLAAIKYWGSHSTAKLNFSVSEYSREIEEMKDMSREEYVASLIRRSSCFSRGASIYRGVTRKKDGRWQARIGQIANRKDIYLGTYNIEEEAAQAYDIAAVKLKGLHAVTNFDICNYSEDIE